MVWIIFCKHKLNIVCYWTLIAIGVKIRGPNFDSIKKHSDEKSNYKNIFG
jgi:hypothetical protein